MSNDIYTTLQGVLKTDAASKVLQLAQSQFPGPIQTALGYYLNGITLQLGPSASLAVDPSSKQLQLQAQLDGADLDLQATPSGATLTLTSKQYTDAQVVLTFSRGDSGVEMALSATMGASLQWPLQSLWPAELDWTPANQIAFSQGQLTLSYATGPSIQFNGQGGLLYSGQPFLNAALSVQRTDQGAGVMFGAVVQQWSPGSLWTPLSALTFNDSGVVVSTIAGQSGSLASLGLLSADDVPAIAADFDIAPGFVLFSSLQLTDSLKAIANFMGDVSQLDLFATYAKDSGDKTLKAVLKNTFSAQGNGVFEFDGFKLEWEDPGQGSSSASASASGIFRPDAGTEITLGLTGSIVPSQGDLSITLKLQNWNQPFGLQTVDIVELQGTVTVGAEAAGVTLSAGGDLKLQNPNAPQYEFDVGFEVEVVDFEVPNGIAVWTQADQQPMQLSNVFNAAFALDFSPQTLDNDHEPEIADVVRFLDEIISIKQFTFWFVEGAQLQKIGDRGPFPAGFGLQAEFSLLDQDDVQVTATLAESADAKAGFSGYILVQKAIAWGSVFALSGWDPTTSKPNGQGPMLAIAATPDGIVVPQINGGNPVRFYSSLYLKFLDVVEDHLYALATTDNQFQLDYAVQNGQPTGGCGAWVGDRITFMLNPQAKQLSASFGFNFGWHDIEWDGITLWGVTLVPKIQLPDFSVAAGLGFSASMQALVVTGYFDFSLFGLDLHLGDQASPYTLLNVNVAGVIAQLKDVAGHLLTALKQEASALIQAVLSGLSSFVAWVKDQWRNFVNGLQLVGQILQDQFKQLGKDLASVLQSLGALAAEVQQAMVALGYELEKVADWLGDLFGCPISHGSNALP
ncbi:hypothetical protein AVHY2522_09185 [Acidovorax sp. SUPP2522]|uniref:hypothetical protein n=1 Tax=unclassified Acidovorax TaxID=2684926 RepID=UPI00234B2DA8|nr:MULTISPECIES: hypothetical protein [unclassified Acidovorax]WCM97032.1 hypothetical protein M5C96_21895 [Acidovorax sp. GBBC 1281]GKT15737.1 hypothetical protein AVHY2522_09185 [Acidovorax sp. SUPP2522]